MGRTLSEKLWDAHVVRHGYDGERDLLCIDLHLVHEVTSPQAFDGLISWALGLSPGSARVRLQAMEEGLDESVPGLLTSFAITLRTMACYWLRLTPRSSKSCGTLPSSILVSSSPSPSRIGRSAFRVAFHIDDVTRQRLLAGLDALGETLEHADDIAAYEAHRPSFMPITS